MNDINWVSTAARLPIHLQVVYVKTRYGSVEHRVTFLTTPTPRWEESGRMFRLDLYEYWRPTDLLPSPGAEGR